VADLGVAIQVGWNCRHGRPGQSDLVLGMQVEMSQRGALAADYLGKPTQHHRQDLPVMTNGQQVRRVIQHRSQVFRRAQHHNSQIRASRGTEKDIPIKTTKERSRAGAAWYLPLHSFVTSGTWQTNQCSSIATGIRRSESPVGRTR